MERDEFRHRLEEAVDELMEAGDSFEDPQLAIDPATHEVSLLDYEEAEKLDESIDTYDMMDFIRMDAEGDWIADEENIDSVVSDYFPE